MAIPRNLANIAPHVAGSSGGITGLTFNATQSASAGANTLDDYEEGTWSPVLTPASGTITANAANDTGAYTKVGRLVTVTGQIVFTSSSASGTITLSGLPFSVANLTETSERFCGNVSLGGFTTGNGLGFVLVDSGTSGSLFTSTAGTPVIAASGSEIYINFSYFTS